MAKGGCHLGHVSINLLQAVNRFTRVPLSTQVRKMGIVAAVFMFILLQGTVYVRIVVLFYRMRCYRL